MKKLSWNYTIEGSFMLEHVKDRIRFAHEILVDKIDSNFTNLRLGLQFPIVKTDAYVLNLNAFGDFNDFIYNESILEGVNDDPTSIVYRSYGFSLGVQF